MIRDGRRDAQPSPVPDPFTETRRDTSLGYVSSRLADETNSRGINALITLVVVALLGVAFYFAPHWTVYRMRAAIESRDVEALSSYVDFPSLRENLKAQLLLIYDVAPSDAKPNSIASLGKAFIAGVTGSIVDAIVTPAGVMVMLKEGKVKPPTRPTPSPDAAAPSGAAEQQPPSSAAAPAAGQAPKYKVEYANFSTVKLKAIDGSPGAFVLRRRNLVQWKLAAVELPGP